MSNFKSYKWFVDALVEIGRSNVSARRIREHGHAERSNEDDRPLTVDEKVRKDFVLGLDTAQRAVLVDMLVDARADALHDTSSFLEDELSVGKLALKRDGEPIPSSPFATMHYDFVCRWNGDAWPDPND